MEKRRKDIESVLTRIKSKRIGLTSFVIASIKSHSITLLVKEVDDKWHQNFGSMLANDHSMRRFCDENNKSKMFKWEVC